MKKLFVFALLVICGSVFAQKPEHHAPKKKHHKKEFMKDLSAEQLATLKTKKMTLALDLDKGQQEKMYALSLAGVKDHRKHMEALKKAMKNGADQKPKLTSEEKFQKMNSQLDKKIADKNKLKSILSEEQFKKWEDLQKHAKKTKRKQHMKQHMKQ